MVTGPEDKARRRGRIATHSDFLAFIAVILGSVVLCLILAVGKFGFQTLSSRGDGPEYLQFAANLLSGNYPYAHFPLYPAIIRILTSFLAPSEAAILWSATAYVLATCVFWKISTHKSVLSGKFLIPLFVSVFTPTLLIYSTAAVADTTAILLSALTYYLMLERREKSMLLCSMGAVASHYLALLMWPAVLFYFARKGIKEVPKAFLTIVPFLLLSLYQYLARGDFLYYFHVNGDYWSARGGLLSYPFATVPYVIENFGKFSLLLLLSTYAIYILGLFLSIRKRDFQSTIFSAPFVIFVTLLGPAGFFFVPRYAEFAFPVLFSFGSLTKRKTLRSLLLIAIVLSIAYALLRVISPSL
jgi:hypothetical protein